MMWLQSRWHAVVDIVVIAGLLMLGVYWWPYTLIGAGFNFVISESSIQSLERGLEDVNWYQDQNGSAVVMEKVDGSRWMMHSGYPSLWFNGRGRTVFKEALIGAGITTLLPADQRNNALILGLGTGISPGVVADYFKHVAIYEIRPAMVELARENFNQANGDVLDQANVDVKLQDGVIGASIGDTEYNGIWVNIPAPGMRGASKVWAAETLRALKARLAPGGLIMFWLHMSVGANALPVITHTITQNLSPCRYFLLGPKYAQIICAPGQSRTEFMAQAPHTLGDVANYVPYDFGEAVAAGELLLKNPAWDDDAPIHSYDHPWFDTRALYLSRFDPNLKVTIPALFAPRYPQRFCELVTAARYRALAEWSCLGAG